MKLHLSKLRTPPEVEQELEWFFTCAESEMGLSSNFAPLLAIALTGVVGAGDPADTMAEGRIAAAHAEGQIRGRLRRMPPGLVGVLATAYEPRAWPPEVVRHFGPTAGIAVRTRSARALDKERSASTLDSVAERLAAAINRHDHTLLATVRAETEAILGPALQAYQQARGVGPSVTPGGAHAQ